MVTDKRHTQVLSTKKHGIFDSNIFDCKIYDTSKLTIELSIEDSLDLGVQQSVEALDLARKVLDLLEAIVAA